MSISLSNKALFTIISKTGNCIFLDDGNNDDYFIPKSVLAIKHFLNSPKVENIFKDSDAKQLILDAKNNENFLHQLNNFPHDEEDESNPAVIKKTIIDTFGEYKDKYFLPLVLEFLKKTVPEEVEKHNLRDPFAIWALEEYAINQENLDDEKPIKAEDLYEIRENLLVVFTKDKDKINKIFQKHDTRELTEYFETMVPYSQETYRGTLAIADLARYADDLRKKLTPREKKIHRADLMSSEVTIIHDGSEGCIYLPHTPESSIELGRQTRWCISASLSDNMFHEYDREGPIFIYVPKITDSDEDKYKHYTSFKFARSYSDGCIRDELDYEFNNTDKHSPYARLHQEALSTLKGGKLDYYRIFSEAEAPEEPSDADFTQWTGTRSLKDAFEAAGPDPLKERHAKYLHHVTCLRGIAPSLNIEDYDDPTKIKNELDKLVQRLEKRHINSFVSYEDTADTPDYYL